jgi:hypothetical protein
VVPTATVFALPNAVVVSVDAPTGIDTVNAPAGGAGSGAPDGVPDGAAGL